MQNWLFQMHPDRFDYDAFYASRPTQCDWLASRYEDEMDRGDKIFFWRAKGREEAWAGLVGLAVITKSPEEKSDTSPAAPYWLDGSESDQVLRASLQIESLHARPVDYDLIKDDPRLNGMEIFRRPIGTNFRVTASEAAVLMAYWNIYSTP